MIDARINENEDVPTKKVLSLKRIPFRKVGSFVKSIENNIRMENRVGGEATRFRTQSFRRHRKSACRSLCKLFKSPLSALPLSLMHGVLVYLYIVYMVAPNNTDNVGRSDVRGSKEIGFKSFGDNIKFEFSCRNDDEEGRQNESTVFQEGELLNITQEWSTNKTNHGGESKLGFHQKIGIGVSVMTITFLIVSGLRWTYVRCVSVLILPGLVAGRGRAILMTFAMSLLLEGPIASINYNLNQVVESQVCMYESVKQSGCYFNHRIEAILKQSNLLLKEQREQLDRDLNRITNQIERQVGGAKHELVEQQRRLERRIDTFKEEFGAIRDIVEGLNKPCGYVNSALGDITDFFNDIGDWFSFKKRRRRETEVCSASIPLPNIDWDTALGSTDPKSLQELQEWLKDLKPNISDLTPSLNSIDSLLKTSSVKNIREKIMGLISSVFGTITRYMVVIKRCFLVVSIMLLVGLAHHYLRQYLSDDAFDNCYIDENIKKLWRSRPSVWPKLTPLRHWEMNESYQVSASLRLSKIEWRRVLIKVLPTFSFSVFVVFLIVIDFGLSEFLANLAVNGKFAVSFSGGEDDGKSGNNRGTYYKVDLSSEPCLPRAKVTRRSNIAFLLTITVIVGLTCIFDAYLSRLRSWISNQFYPRQGEERACYLYNRLKFGRNARRMRVRPVVARELKKRRRLEELSVIPSLISIKFFLLKFLKKRGGKINDVSSGNVDRGGSSFVDVDDVGNRDTNSQTSSVVLATKKICCPGCLSKVPVNETKFISVDLFSTNQSEKLTSCDATICLDCAKDL